MFCKILSLEETTTKTKTTQTNTHQTAHLCNQKYKITCAYLWLQNVVIFDNPVSVISTLKIILSLARFLSSSKELFWDGRAVDCN